MQKKDFSVVVPVYNSEKTLEELFLRLRDVFTSMEKSFEVVFVHDSGPDRSFEVLRELKSKFPDEVLAIDLFRNYGQQNAIMCGFNYCSGNYVITIDDDLQNPPEEIPKLFAKLNEGYDAVFGLYLNKQHKSYKNLGSKLIRKLNHKIFALKSNLNFSSYRLIKGDVVDLIKKQRTPFPYISGMILSVTNKIANENIEHHQRKFGSSNYNLKKLISLSFNLLINYSSLPLKFAGYFGLAISILGFLIGAFFFIQQIIKDSAPAGWTSLIVLTSLFNSVIFVILFIIGEYLSRILREIAKSDQYTVREIL
jgi:glycosyltransferase involved in cell wall biosynthesis